MGIKKDDIYKLNPEVAIKYDDHSNWWVLKGKEGVTFTPFTAKEKSVEYLLDALDKISAEKAKLVFKDELKKILPEKIYSEPKFFEDSRVKDLFSETELRTIKSNAVAIDSTPCNLGLDGTLMILKSQLNPQ